MKSVRLSYLLPLVCALYGQSQDQPVSHEDLISGYERYNGKQVVISGEVLSGPEMTLMFLRSASSGTGTPEGMLVALSASAIKKPGRLEKNFTKSLKKTGHIEATLEGRFEGAPDRMWGHLLCCRFRFTVDRVISLK